MEFDEIQESRRIRKWKVGFGEETETSGYVDNGVKILIAVVIGAHPLADSIRSSTRRSCRP